MGRNEGERGAKLAPIGWRGCSGICRKSVGKNEGERGPQTNGREEEGMAATAATANYM